MANAKSFCSPPNNAATASEILRENKTDPQKSITYSSLISDSVSVNQSQPLEGTEDLAVLLKYLKHCINCDEELWEQP